jgi:hypothetical protein
VGSGTAEAHGTQPNGFFCATEARHGCCTVKGRRLGRRVVALQRHEGVHMFDRDTLMKMMKLERSRSMQRRVLNTVSLFTGGLLVGAAAVLLLAPGAGPSMRKKPSLRKEASVRPPMHRESDTHPIIERPDAFVKDGVA